MTITAFPPEILSRTVSGRSMLWMNTMSGSNLRILMRRYGSERGPKNLLVFWALIHRVSLPSSLKALAMCATFLVFLFDLPKTMILGIHALPVVLRYRSPGRRPPSLSFGAQGARARPRPLR